MQGAECKGCEGCSVEGVRGAGCLDIDMFK